MTIISIRIADAAFSPRLVIWEVLELTRGPRPRLWLSWLRILLLLLLGAAACATRVWYTSGTQIARMDPYSNPIATAEDVKVRALSYALVHGMCPWLSGKLAKDIQRGGGKEMLPILCAIYIWE